MTKRQPQNVPASIKAKLRNVARKRGEDFNLLLVQYGIERLLYRLSKSEHSSSFVLKGALLFLYLASAPHRPTRDVDFLSRGSADLLHIEKVIREVLQSAVDDDGLVFDLSSLQVRRIKGDQEYEGVRVLLDAFLGNARIPLQIDIGFGDAVTPNPTRRDIPCLLDFDAPSLFVYPWETVVSEKYQALVELGMTNSRMKDFFDLRFMAREFRFDGASLSKAVQATFERRKTELPYSRPIALSSEFSGDAIVNARWLAFLRRSRLESLSLDLQIVSDEIWRFLEPITSAILSGNEHNKVWEPEGPWK